MGSREVAIFTGDWQEPQRSADAAPTEQNTGIRVGRHRRALMQVASDWT